MEFTSPSSADLLIEELLTTFPSSSPEYHYCGWSFESSSSSPTPPADDFYRFEPCPLVLDDYSSSAAFGDDFLLLCHFKNETTLLQPGKNLFQECRAGGTINDEYGIKRKSRSGDIVGCYVAHQQAAATHHHREDDKDKLIKLNNGKKREGQPPSKNLMAERRRRKRLNDRLSMLRSIVPKISKMDRTSILADALDYMKELLSKVGRLHSEDTPQYEVPASSNKSSPKFEVERREMETRIEIGCATKPGLLLSTLRSMEALGLDIQHFLVSCYTDFSMRASCFETVDENRTILSTEDLRHALFLNAGYGGKRV